MKKTDLSRLLPFFAPYRIWMILVLIMLLFIAFLTALPPWLIQYAVDDVLPSGNSRWLLWLGAGILLLALAEGLLSFVQQVTSEWIGQKMIMEIRSLLFQHLNHLSYSFFDRAKVGDLISRVISDTETLKRFIAFGLLKVITNILTIGWILLTLFYWSPWLGFLFLLMIPLMVHAMHAYSLRVRPAFRRIRSSNGALTAFCREHFAGIEVIKLFGNERHASDRFEEESNGLLRHTLAANRTTSLWLPYTDALLGIFSGMILLAGGWMTVSGWITPGSLIGFFAYTNLLSRPIRQTGFLLSLFQQADVAAGRIGELLDTKETVKDEPGAVPFRRFRESLEMADVSFSYREKPVLQRVSFQVQPGETVAITGPSGAGKTTLVYLLLGFYAPDQGVLRLDGKPLSAYTHQSLREKMGLVHQHPFLFDGTIGENIALGLPDASMKIIRQAAEEAQLDPFIQQLPLGYDTPIGERGVRLSGGQAQRLALARTLLRRPEILVLDEPTASVDNVTDEAIMATVEQVMAGKTLLIIAHRLSTLRNASRVIFLEHGSITGSGNHEHLFQNHVTYRQYASRSGFLERNGV